MAPNLSLPSADLNLLESSELEVRQRRFGSKELELWRPVSVLAWFVFLAEQSVLVLVFLGE
jgi:hypothetical protein